jgi:hypothetical protein
MHDYSTIYTIVYDKGLLSYTISRDKLLASQKNGLLP